MAMVWIAWLSWRSPRRFSRWRVCCPDEASKGATPARSLLSNGGGGWVVWFWGFPVGWDDWVLMVVGGG